MDIYLGVTKLYVHNKTSRWMFTAALFISIKTWKQPKYPSTGEWTENKAKLILSYKEQLLSNKGEQLLIPATAQVNLKCITYQEKETRLTYCDPICRTFWKSLNYRDKEQISGCQEVGVEPGSGYKEVARENFSGES